MRLGEAHLYITHVMLGIGKAAVDSFGVCVLLLNVNILFSNTVSISFHHGDYYLLLGRYGHYFWTQISALWISVYLVLQLICRDVSMFYILLASHRAFRLVL